MKELRTARAPAPTGAYSQGIVAGDFVFVAGQAGKDPLTGLLDSDDIEGQTAQTLSNIAAILETAGLGLSDIVKATVHLADMSLFPRFDATYRRFFAEPLPVRTTVGSVMAGILVEIDGVAFSR